MNMMTLERLKAGGLLGVRGSCGYVFIFFNIYINIIYIGLCVYVYIFSYLFIYI